MDKNWRPLASWPIDNASLLYKLLFTHKLCVLLTLLLYTSATRIVRAAFTSPASSDVAGTRSRTVNSGSDRRRTFPQTATGIGLCLCELQRREKKRKNIVYYRDKRGRVKLKVRLHT